MKLICSSILILFISFNISYAGQQYTDEEIANAIYFAEGGKKAKVPYGILSIKCYTEKECRQICLNTIRNNRRRYKEYGHKKYDTYLKFLASRYCPIGAKNDPNNLNQYWLKNVKWYLEKGK